MKRSILVLAFLVCAPAARAQDAFDLHQAIIHSSPADVADWPIAANITHIDVQPGDSGGFNVQSAALNQWPDYTPPGWGGPIEYTTWACVQIDSGWHCAGIIQEWRGRGFTGAGWLENDNYNKNWAYDANRWGAMSDYVPKAGDTIGILLTAGNARGVGGVTSVRSRTNVVLVRLPAGDSGSFDFSASPVVTPPAPVPTVPVPVPTPTPPPVPAVDLSGLSARLDALAAQIAAQTTHQDAARDAQTAAITTAVNNPAWYAKLANFLATNPIAVSVEGLIGGWIAAKKL
ncbi:MAG TPA: hypothetical protein VEU08_24035 [Vicinamibacterales bacterium]|nr:hypothetical protein [Vicinamibacterales bacterium]